MLAALFTGNRNIVVGDYSLRILQKDELLIKVACCGICGTDRHIFEGKAPSSIPVILGHEFSGIIADGDNNDPLFPSGSHVAVNPNIHCGYCNYCKKGKIQFCTNLKALGVTINGGFAEYVIVPKSQVYILPSDLDLDIASFAEPLSCCLRGIQQADIRPGDKVVVIGGGTVGLLMVQLAKNAGAANVTLVEPDPSKRLKGTELGADFAFDPSEPGLEFKINDNMPSETAVIIECVGKSETVQHAVRLAGKGTKIVIFGLAPSDHEVTLNLQYLFKNELKIFNSYLNPFTFAPAIDLLVSGRVNVRKLISERIALNNINSIFQNSSNSSIKQQIINN